MKIAVSILSSNYSEEETIKKINETDADYIHVDVMDSTFVLGKTPKREFLHTSRKPLDVHLMVSSPFDFITSFALLNTEAITIHVELEDDIEGLLNYIKSCGIKCGLALNPETSPKAVSPYISLIDEVLVMTVTPGKGGQELMDSTLYKIDILNEMKKEYKKDFKIIVDGGINGDTIKKVLKADVCVSGSFICKSEDFQERIDKLRL